VPVPTSTQYGEMLDTARHGGYALAAFNVTSSETLNAAMRGFAEAGADGIVQITTGGAAYLSGDSVGDAARGAIAFAALARELADAYPVLVGVHTDHCPPEQLDAFITPLLDASSRRRRRGEEPLFNSHMFDGSTLPLAENLRISRELLDRCRELGVVLEVECGTVGGEEDGIAAEAGERLYTTVEDLLQVAEVLGSGERGRYLLAATFGNVHGSYAPGRVRLRPEILRDGQEALAASKAGARFDYVFHGSSGSSDAEIREAIGFGVVKVNVDSDMQYAFTRAVADHVLRNYDGVVKVDGGVGDKRAYDPRAWGRRAEAAMAARAAAVCETVGSAGRSLSPGLGLARGKD
jgi:fructose-bisphosphate aldolase, class II